MYQKVHNPGVCGLGWVRWSGGSWGVRKTNRLSEHLRGLHTWLATLLALHPEAQGVSGLGEGEGAEWEGAGDTSTPSLVSRDN